MVENGSNSQSPQALHPPLGLLPTKIDDRGRLKFPAEARDFYLEQGIKEFFITTTNEKSVDIYTLQRWYDNLAILENENDEDSAAIELIAKTYGNKVAMDDQGRLVIDKSLRDMFGLDGAEVRLSVSGKGVIRLIKSDEHQRSLQTARERVAAGALRDKKTKGFV